MTNAIRTAKEWLRHSIYSAGVRLRPQYVRGDSVEQRFSAIYDEGVWKHGSGDVPASGTGSTVEATRAVRARLPAFLNEVRAEVLLDIGCGDFTWMKSVPLSQHYIGVDVVQSVIDVNRELYSSEVREFRALDAIEDTLPDADVIICREVLFHLSFEHALKVLRNCLKKERRFFILTSDSGTGFNSNIETGGFRLLNLERKPFSLQSPLEKIEDPAVAPERYLGIWAAEQLMHLA